jgi:DNA-binding transcriptional LysR family regulator
MHPRQLDLNLLRVFRALMFEKSVTGAAVALGLTQPAVSHALMRLRQAYQDPLFLRTGRRMEPTARALELSALICESLSRIESTLERRFDPKSLTRTFRIAFIDYGGIFFLPSLMSRLVSEAPGAKLLPEYMDNTLGARRLQDPEVDFGIGMLRENSATWRRINLFDDPFVIAVRKNHPLTRRSVSLKDLCKYKFVRIPLFDSYEPLLESQGLTRHFGATAENFLPVPFIISRSDLLALIPRSVYFVFRQICNLRDVKSDLDLPPYSVELVFDKRKEINPAHRWLIGCITALAREVAHDLRLDQTSKKPEQPKLAELYSSLESSCFTDAAVRGTNST